MMFVGSKHEDNNGQPPPHRNWVIVLLFNVLTAILFTIMAPFLYQFITSPKSRPIDHDEGDDFWPGLGESDLVYAWAFTMFAVGEIVIILFYGLIASNFPYTLSFILGCLLAISGGILHATAVKGWMVIVSQFLLGCGSGTGVLVHTYIGEQGTMMDKWRIKHNKKPLKFVMHICLSFTMNGGVLLGYGIQSIISQFNVNPFRWPGWFISAMGGLFILAVLVIFKETKNCSVSTPTCTPVKQLSLLKCFSRKVSFYCILSYLFITACYLANGILYVILLTTLAPILRDQFGFSVYYSVYFSTAVSISLIGSSILQTIVKVLKLNNRLVLGCALLMALIGSILIGDWQSLSSDPCSRFTQFNSTYENITSSTELDINSSYYSNSSFLDMTVEKCEALSNSDHQCFWNPLSRVTGRVCVECPQSCLSQQASLNFYQFTVGVFLVSLAAPLLYIIQSAITTDITPVKSQGKALGIVLSSEVISRMISPYVFVETYQLSGRHTYAFMSISVFSFASLLLTLVILYRHLGPIVCATSSSTDGSSSNLKQVNPLFTATNEVDNNIVNDDCGIAPVSAGSGDITEIDTSVL